MKEKVGWVMIVETKYEKNKNLLAVGLAGELLSKQNKPVFLCVGTDKVVGDSLGALVGEMLKNKYQINGYIYGTLDRNVTAVNLAETIKEIKQSHPYSPIVLIDGVLGPLDEVGQVKYYPSGAYPSGEYGTGYYVGDYSILAVVNCKGMDSLTFVKSVRLKTIITMAEFIADSINRAYRFSQNLIL